MLAPLLWFASVTDCGESETKKKIARCAQSFAHFEVWPVSVANQELAHFLEFGRDLDFRPDSKVSGRKIASGKSSRALPGGFRS
jgi:hypothetical protein